MKDYLFKDTAVFLCILFLHISISGCAGIEREGTGDWHKGFRHELIVEPPLITPKVARSGENIRQELQFTLMSAEKDRLFNVMETVFISDGNDTIELTKKESRKSQGTHKSIVQLVIPRDLSAGLYRLITVIRTEKEKKTVGVNFRVE